MGRESRRSRMGRAPVKRYGQTPPGIETPVVQNDKPKSAPLPSSDLNNQLFSAPDINYCDPLIKPGTVLPPEIIEQILHYVSSRDWRRWLTVHSDWYYMIIPLMYRQPVINANNYKSFLETLVKRPRLGHSVKILDLGPIIQTGKNSSTAKMLRKCSASLEVFRASQTSFGFASLVSLKHCLNLKELDLSCVSETMDLRDLFATIRYFSQLRRLLFPRSSIYCQNFDMEWPPNLEYLGISGGLSDEFVRMTVFPSTITTLTVTHCPFIKTESVLHLLRSLGSNLKGLCVAYPMPFLRFDGLDSLLTICPNLTRLKISLDYVTRRFVGRRNVPQPHPLRHLELDYSGQLGAFRKLQADDISLAILEDRLPELTTVRAAAILNWGPGDEEVLELAEILNDKETGGLYIV